MEHYDIGGRAGLVKLGGAIAVVTLAIWLSLRVLGSTPTSKAVSHPPPRVFCTLDGLLYSEGAVVRTAHGRVRCRAGKWLALQHQ
jgi:hypothetical protein